MGIALILALAVAAGAGDSCAVDKAALLALPFDKFDQDMQGGWRVLGARPGCERATADLIADYRRAHWGQLKPNELHGAYWHEGQLRAAAGETEKAVRLLMDGVNPDEDPGDFADYALGTVAFLHHDLAALKAARARAAALPEPAWFDKSKADFKAKYKVDLHWPPNLEVLDGFIACFDKPYKEAYGDACRRKPRR